MFESLFVNKKQLKEKEDRIRELEHELDEANMLIACMVSEPHILNRDDLLQTKKCLYIGDREIKKYSGYKVRRSTVGFPEFVYKIWAVKE